MTAAAVRPVHADALIEVDHFDGQKRISLHGLPRDVFDCLRGSKKEQAHAYHLVDDGRRYWSSAMTETKRLRVTLFTTEPPS